MRDLIEYLVPWSVIIVQGIFAAWYFKIPSKIFLWIRGL